MFLMKRSLKSTKIHVGKKVVRFNLKPSKTVKDSFILEINLEVRKGVNKLYFKSLRNQLNLK